jgi:transposase InsO family protein
MGIKSRDWESIGKIVSQIKKEGLTYVAGAKRFGIPLQDIREYRRRFKDSPSPRSAGKVKNWEELGDYVSRIRALGLSYTEGALRFGLDVKAIYRYNHNKRIKEKREKALAVSSESGDVGVSLGASSSVESASVKESGCGAVSSGIKGKVHGLLPPEVEELIVTYRRDHPDYGYKRIEEYLKSRHFVVVPRKKIREVLKSHGLIGEKDSSFDKADSVERVKGSRRFEASYPRELYQMDITYVYLANNAIYYLVLIVDDHSRFCVACELRRDQRGLSMIEVLHRAIERYGKPVKLLTDQGSSFYSWSREQTLFSRYLDDMKIEHIVADPHSPQTLGKVERLNQTVQRELLNKGYFSNYGYPEACSSIGDYFHHYNYSRPHQGIGGAFPASRFHGVIGESSRIESELCGHGLDFSRGYLVFKMFEHTISIVCNSTGLQVFLDGNLLESRKELSTPTGPDTVKPV